MKDIGDGLYWLGYITWIKFLTLSFQYFDLYIAALFEIVKN